MRRFDGWAGWGRAPDSGLEAAGKKCEISASDARDATDRRAGAQQGVMAVFSGLKRMLGVEKPPVATLDRGSPVMVIGMHRSGTSFLTGSLQLAGLSLGPHSTQNAHNQKGNRENADFVSFHNAVLEARGFAWDNPPPGALRWSSTERDQARRLIADFATTAPWGFKDPRSLLMADQWLSLCPQATFIGIFRNPVEVARSLVTRSYAGGGIIAEQRAFELWEIYNCRLLALYRRRPFPLLCFDDAEAAMHAKLNLIFPQIGLQPLAEAVFFSADLKTETAQADAIPRQLRALYDQLKVLQC